MALPPDLPGFSYDYGQAQSLAGLMRPLVAMAAGNEVSPPTQLAALGILVAEVILASKMRRVAASATAALATMEQELVGRQGTL